MFKDFFLKKTEWGFPFEKKATKAQQWYTCLLVIIGVFTLSEWITAFLIGFWEGITNKKDVMEEIETE